MKRFLSPKDRELGRVLYHKTFQGSGGVVSIDKDKCLFAILEVRAAGAWSCNYRSSDPEDAYSTRNGNGDAQFNQPWIAEKFDFAGVEEVSGYWIKGGGIL